MKEVRPSGFGGEECATAHVFWWGRNLLLEMMETTLMGVQEKGGISFVYDFLLIWNLDEMNRKKKRVVAPFLAFFGGEGSMISSFGF